MLSIHRPSSALPAGLARPGPGAPPQLVAEYYRSMLVADGAIPGFGGFSPFEPAGFAGAEHDHANGADYFFGRAPPRTFASFSPFPEEALADLASEGGLPSRASPADIEPQGTPAGEHTDSPRPTGSRRHRGGPLAFPEGDGLASMMFGPRASGPGGRSEDDLIAEQLAQVREEERIFLAKLQEAQRTRHTAAPPATPSDHAVRDQAKEQPSDAEEALAELAADAEEDKELEAVLAASRAAAELQGAAELEAALALSAEAATELSDDVSEEVACPPQAACQEAGIDIPFETPKALLDDAHPTAPVAAATPIAACPEAGIDIPFETPSALLVGTATAAPVPVANAAAASVVESSGAATSKGKRSTGKKGKGKGAQV
jgi:hypothetical protein